MKTKLIIGGSGFIGSQLANKLIFDNNIIIIDNFSRGKLEYIEDLNKNVKCKILNYDISDNKQCMEAFRIATSLFEIDEVWHFAANSDIPAGIIDSNIDTVNVGAIPNVNVFSLLCIGKHSSVTRTV